MRKKASLVEMSEKRLRAIFAESGHDFSADECLGLTFGDLDGAAIEDFRKRWSAKARQAEDRRWGSLWRWLPSPEPDPKLLSPWPLPRLPNWAEPVTASLTDAEWTAVRQSVQRGTP